jgi:hypothetical protein
MDQQRKELKGGEKGMRMVSAKFRLTLIRRTGKSILTPPAFPAYFSPI